MFRTIAAALAATALFTASARCQLLYASSFETPNYHVGQSIDGIDNWFSFISPNANQIVNGFSTASLGRRAVRCWGGDPNLQTTGGILDGAWTRNASINPAYAANALVHVQCNVRLDGPDTGTGPNDDLVSANLGARNGVGGSVSMFLSSTGDVYCFAGSVNGATNYAFQTPVQLGHYATLGITLNYRTHMATFWVNYHAVGTAPFGGQANEAFNGAWIEFAAYDNPLYVDPSLYTGYFDNLLVFAAPTCH